MVALAMQKNPQRMTSDIPCEKRLFHGTSPDAVDAICKQNFDWRVCGKNGTKYGKGSYFAANASYSHSFAKCGSDGFRFMFLARVLVGSFIKGEPEYLRPPSKDPSNPSSDLYDSCVNNESNPAVFVIFDSDQFYPEYVIKYFALKQNPNFQAHTTKSAGIIHSPIPHGAVTGSASNLQKPVFPPSQGLTANPWGPSTGLSAKRALSHSATSLLQPIAAPRGSQGLTGNQWDSSSSPSANRALSHSTSNLLHPLAAPKRSQGLTANPKSPSTSLSANTTLSDSIPSSYLRPPIPYSQALKVNLKGPSVGLSTQRALSESASNLQQPIASPRGSQGLKANTKSPVTTLSADRSLLHSASNLQQPIASPRGSQGLKANAKNPGTTLSADRSLLHSTSNLQQPIASPRGSQGLKANTKSPGTTLSADRPLLHSASNLQQPIKASTSSQVAANFAGSSDTLTASDSNARSRKKQKNDSKPRKCLIL